MAISTANVDAGSDSPRLARTQIKEAIDTVNNLETSAGSSGVGFIQSGTGAVATTVQAELRRNKWVEQWGIVGNGATDNSANYVLMATDISGGEIVNFQSLHYKGKININKSVQLKGNKCHVTPTDDTKPTIYIGPDETSIVAYSVVEVTISHGATQFSVVGASGLFGVGDIGYLWDSAVRPTGGSVNFECVKIKSIVGDVITVVGFIRSYKGIGPIKFYHTTQQFKDVTIEDIEITPNDTNQFAGLKIFFIDRLRVRRIKGSNFTGPLVQIRYCWDVEVDDVDSQDPYAVGSGQGYGVELVGITNYKIKNIKGDGCRHAFDQDSCYWGDIDGVLDNNDQGQPCGLAHNGFAGYITAKNIRCKTSQYPVLMSGQGYGTAAGEALRENHPFRNIQIENVCSVMRSDVTVNGTLPTVYFQNSIAGSCSVRNIELRWEDGTSIGVGSSAFVRVDGLVLGTLEIDNVTADKVGRVFFSNGNYGTGTPNVGNITIRNVRTDSILEIARVQGRHRIDVDIAYLGTPVGTSGLLYLDTAYGRLPLSFRLGRNILYDGADVQLFTSTGTPIGCVDTLSRSTATTINVIAAQVLTQTQVQNNYQRLNLLGPAGVGTIVLGNFPVPNANGLHLIINGWSTGYNDVTIPGAGGFAAAITFSSTKPFARFVSVGGLWREC